VQAHALRPSEADCVFGWAERCAVERCLVVRAIPRISSVSFLKVLYRHGTISIVVINMGLSRDTPLTYTERFTYRTLVVANVLYRHWTISFIGFYKGLSRDAAFTYTERFLYRTFVTISALPCTTRCHTATPNIPSVLKDRHGTINVFVNN